MKSKSNIVLMKSKKNKLKTMNYFVKMKKQSK